MRKKADSTFSSLAKTPSNSQKKADSMLFSILEKSFAKESVCSGWSEKDPEESNLVESVPQDPLEAALDVTANQLGDTNDNNRDGPAKRHARQKENTAKGWQRSKKSTCLLPSIQSSTQRSLASAPRNCGRAVSNCCSFPDIHPDVSKAPVSWKKVEKRKLFRRAGHFTKAGPLPPLSKGYEE